MRTYIFAILVIAAVPALAGFSVDHYTGHSYEVEIVRTGQDSGTTVCLSFGKDGRLSLADTTLPLIWSKQYDYPRRFVAVTSFPKRAMIEYDIGMHGNVLDDRSLAGGGIDRFGNTFEFRGVLNDQCGNALSQRASTGSTDLAALVDATQPLFDPCWVSPGSHVPCDPVLDPTRADTENVPVSRLSGNSYQVILLADSNEVREYCWTFVDERTVRSQDRRELRWAVDGNADPLTSFQMVTTTSRDPSMAYHGNLYGDLLYAAGIEAQGTKKVAVYGYGQPVAACEPF